MNLRRTAVGARWIGPAALLAALWWVGFDPLKEVWREGRALPMIGAAALNAAIIAIKSWRWRRILAVQGIEYPAPRAARHYTISCALAAWTPGRLGDLSKGIAIHREGAAPLGQALSSVLADRLMDVAALATVASIALMVAAGWGWPWGVGAPLVCAALLAWIARRPIGGSWTRHLPAPISQALSDLGRISRGALIPIAAGTVASTILVFFQGWLVARGLGLPAGFGVVAAGLSYASLASLLPVSVAGLGTRDASLALALAPSGVTLPQAMALSTAHLVVAGGSLAVMGAVAFAIRLPGRDQRPADVPWTASRRVP